MGIKIFLVGMPGAGKTTLGKLLSRALDWRFTDVDQELERIEGNSVTEIFKEEGETYFRSAERNVLKSLAETPGDLIIATGGGAPCFHGNMKFMNAMGITVFLNPALEVLQKRIEQEDQRPLFHGTSIWDKVNKLYNERLHYYQEAKFTIKEDNPNINHIISDLGIDQ